MFRCCRSYGASGEAMAVQETRLQQLLPPARQHHQALQGQQQDDRGGGTARPRQD